MISVAGCAVRPILGAMARPRTKPGSRPAGDPKRAIAYLRVSTEDQSLGPEAQRAQIEAWAARAGVEVVAWFADHGVSGSKPLEERPQLFAALGALRESGAGVFLVAKRDRLARDTVVAGMIDRAVATAGGVVVAADGVGNGEAPADQFMRSIIDAAAQYERAMIRARTKAALKVKRDRGELTGEAPLGWHVGADGKALEPDAGERALVDRAKALRAGGLSFSKVAAQLAAEGGVTRDGRPPHAVFAFRLCRCSFDLEPQRTPDACVSR